MFRSFPTNTHSWKFPGSDWVTDPAFVASTTHYNAQQQWRDEKIRWRPSSKNSYYENREALRDYL